MGTGRGGRAKKLVSRTASSGETAGVEKCEASHWTLLTKKHIERKAAKEVPAKEEGILPCQILKDIVKETRL